MNRIIFIIMLVLGFMSFTELYSQVNEFTHPSILSFEKNTDLLKAESASVLSISNQHFKHGKKSLHWQWEKTGDSWRINRLISYTSHNPLNDNSVATFVFWVYAPQAYSNGKLIFSFYKDTRLCSWFEYKLDFIGWSGAWVAFDRDMQGNPEEGMDELRVSVEGVSGGELYFDHFILSSFHDIRYHTADFQVPYINAGTTSHWLTLLDSWNKNFDITLPDSITDSCKMQMNLIENRLIKTITETSKPVALTKLLKRYRAYQIHFNTDGTIAGLPVFFERYGETYERMGAPRYNLLYNNDMGISKLNKLLFDLAIAYRNNTDGKEKETIAGMFIDLTRHMLDQGFRTGSAMGTLHHLGYSMRQYYASAILMRDVLALNQLDKSVQKAMEWFAGTGEVKTRPLLPGMDVDAFNTSLTGRLASILMMEDTPEKVRYLQTFTRWVDNGLQYSDGTSGTFKIDGSIFHHRHNYPAYAVGGLEGAVNAVWILHGTSFSVGQTGRENLKKALLSMRYYCNLVNWPLSLSGRHPDGKGHLNPAHYARLAWSGTPDGKDTLDREMAATYIRMVGDSITPDKRKFTKMGILPERLLSGNRVFPYSSLSVHRRDNWMVTAMGHSRYLWATETYLGANLYGRYLNHGQLQIMATGEPISNFGSGFTQAGWDWNHFPGTTATEIPMKKLRATIKNLDAESGYEELLLSDEAFAGGISIGHRDGAYAMKLHEHDKYNGSLRARKSFFFFDNRVIALGSNIRSGILDNEVHTTLFQVYQPAQLKPMLLNGKRINAFPYRKVITQKVTEITDGLNNHFFVKNAEVQLKRSVQHSLHEETDEPTQNPFSLAYINHGKKATRDHYEYLALIQPDTKTLKSVRKSLSPTQQQLYQVLQQDSVAHIVRDRMSNTTAYVFFEAGVYRDDSCLLEVSMPALIMTRALAADQLLLSVADPDLRFYEGATDEQYDESGKRVERSVYSRTWINNPSKPSLIALTINGNWQLDEPSDYIHVKSCSVEKTTFEVLCQHGLSREVLLKRR
ncbi:MAG: chondroitinase family polysaccharide lyase [Paludibacteraceae bacterium]